MKILRTIACWLKRKLKLFLNLLFFSETTKNVWESQYISGRWNYLRKLDELAHYSIIVGYINCLKPESAVLDVGCGEGVLLRNLKPHGYSRYVGIDISDTAISRILIEKNNKTFFIQANAETYYPASYFDVIVFNEALYYFKKPLEVVDKFSCHLLKNGILIVSSYVGSDRAMSILIRLKKKYPLLDETRIVHEITSKSWICSVFSGFRT